MPPLEYRVSERRACAMVGCTALVYRHVDHPRDDRAPHQGDRRDAGALWHCEVSDHSATRPRRTSAQVITLGIGKASFEEECTLHHPSHR